MKYIKVVLSILLRFIIGFIYINIFYIIENLKSLSVRFPENPKVDVNIKWIGKE